MAFNVSSAYTSSFHTPKQALDFDYAWAPNFSSNLNDQELARKTAQTVLGKETLESLGNREYIKEQYEQALKQKKWMWDEQLKQDKKQRWRDVISAGVDWIGNKNSNITAELENIKKRRDALDITTGQDKQTLVNQVLTKQLVNAGFSQDEANRIVKSNAVQWPGLQ
tara:strand:- start:2326 stop:2826 length:501 start_codon:yes stop_codon:yes gene_type:complete